MPVHVDPDLPVHPFTVEDLHAMVDAGILGEDDRVELLRGVLVEMSPPGPAHSFCVSTLLAIVVPVANAAGLHAVVQDPLNVRQIDSEPQPDLSVVPRLSRDRRPEDAVLVVEVSVSSRRVDLGTKAEIYAQAHVPEYWVLDVDRRTLLVHTEPKDGHYGLVARHDEDAAVTARGLPLTVTVGALL